MSQLTKIQHVQQIVKSTELDFNKLAKVHGAVTFEKEQTFAIQALKNSDYLCKIAYQNKDSLRMAVVNVAAIGLSLNPVLKQAYLVPRDGKVCLDISWMGYVQLGVEARSIRYAKAEVVCENDTFVYHGLGKEPTHEYQPFGNRGKKVGAYCVAVTYQDDYLTTMMPIDEVYSIRDRFSKSWQSHIKDGKKSPWADDEDEMIRKTVVRRAYKSWPMTDTRGENRLAKAVHMDEDIREKEVGPSTQESIENQADRMEELRGMLMFIERDEGKFIEFLGKTFDRKLEQLEDLTDIETDQAESMLKGFVDIKMKENSSEEKDENSEAS